MTPSMVDSYPGAGAPITFKPEVRASRIHPAIFHAIGEASVVWGLCGASELVVTSLNDSDHRNGSRHYTGEAVDLRTKNLPTRAAKLEAAQKLRVVLGEGFVVILEHLGKTQEHVHVSYVRDGGAA